MSVMHGYFMEPSRKARMLNRQRLKQILPRYGVSEGRYPAQIPGAWLRDPIEPEQRRIFAVGLREALYAGQLDYHVNVILIANKSPRVTLRSNPSNPEKEEENRKMREEQDAARSQESHDKEAAEAQRWIKIVDDSDVPGLSEGEGISGGIKFFVFVQSDVGEEILTSFLESTPDASPRTSSYRYEFPRSETNATSQDTSSEPEDAKSILECRRYMGWSVEEVHQFWLTLIEPFSGTRSMYGMHAYLVLDEQTVEDGDTVLLATETDGEFRSRRVDFEALKEGLVLKCIEALKLDIDQMPGDWTGVIRGPVMKIADELWKTDEDNRQWQESKRESEASGEHGEQQTTK